jgi:hypothetical protein
MDLVERRNLFCDWIPFRDSSGQNKKWFQKPSKTVSLDRTCLFAFFCRAPKRGFWLCLELVLIFTAQSRAQDTLPENADRPGQSASQTEPSASVHGLVLNAASGEPLPRALVRLSGDFGTGTLTDGDGRYEIPGIALGPQQIEVIKPGFIDETAQAAAGVGYNAREFAHTVIVGPEMPNVNFRMVPVNSIRGQVQLSTGDLADGIGVTLLKEIVENGRKDWQMIAGTRTNADGVYRFGGLAAGLYAIYAEPTMESNAASILVEPGSARNVVRNGYPIQFYPEAQDLAEAAKIQLHGGEEAQANLLLTLEPFHAVTATLAFPAGKAPQDSTPNRVDATYAVAVTDTQGHQLPYVAQYEPPTHRVQVFLPEGHYMFVVTAATRPRLMGRGPGTSSAAAAREDRPMTGAVEFSVGGEAVQDLRIPLATVLDHTIQVNLARTNTHALTTTGSEESEDQIFLTLSPTGGWFNHGMIDSFAAGALSGPLTTSPVQPGTYWAHTILPGKRVCESSLSAGGANLAREPLVLGIAGPAAPLTLNLRDDCARLTLTLPAAASGSGLGEEPYYTVYVIPDFDSTEDAEVETLRPSTGGKITLEGLTPGNYRVFAFDKPVALAYRDREALQALPNSGQSIELSAGVSASLMLEVPNP